MFWIYWMWFLLILSVDDDDVVVVVIILSFFHSHVTSYEMNRSNFIRGTGARYLLPISAVGYTCISFVIRICFTWTIWFVYTFMIIPPDIFIFSISQSSNILFVFFIFGFHCVQFMHRSWVMRSCFEPFACLYRK